MLGFAFFDCQLFPDLFPGLAFATPPPPISRSIACCREIGFPRRRSRLLMPPTGPQSMPQTGQESRPAANTLVLMAQIEAIPENDQQEVVGVLTFAVGAVGAVGAPHKQGLPVPPLDFQHWGQWGQIIPQ